MIRDRGRIKWTAMMLPEHVKCLRDWVKEDQYEQPKEMDEQQLELMNKTVTQAMESGQDITITYYQNHRYEIIIGTIHHCDKTAQRLHVIDRFEAVHRIPLETIVDIRLTDK
ncbi:YolD-like family protein [Neobacillus fumarioli]|uniref:YolD-like family protein n=1 Tax=Neobacillus fumarioli TaxID=105229 RepID=UPI00083118CA|nr:YolD-like family protein [Neobacillus fumarioli]